MAPITTSFFFNSFDNTTFRDLELQGDAFLCVDGRLSLTKPNTPNSVGAVLYSHSIQFSDADCQLIFDTTITFQIDHPGGGSTADGIAFFIAPKCFNIPRDASGGSLAIFDPPNSDKIFAVEFATFYGNPRIGIDLASRDNSTSVDFNNYLGKKVTATISYREGRVTVFAFTDTDKFYVSRDVDLSQFLNQEVQVGVSASSGDCKENHYVCWWSFNSVLPEDEKSGGSSSK